MMMKIMPVLAAVSDRLSRKRDRVSFFSDKAEQQRQAGTHRRRFGHGTDAAVNTTG